MSATEGESPPPADDVEEPEQGAEDARDESGPRETLTESDRDELTAVIDELQAENRRLRREYTRAKQSEYRRSALALVILGVGGVAGGVAFPAAREVLFILGAVGLFAGVLVRYLTPEQFVTATVVRSILDTVAETESAVRSELGLTDTAVYVPTGEYSATGVPVKRFIPQTTAYEIPDADALGSVFVLPESETRRGVALHPTAARLVSELEKSATDAIATDPTQLVEELADAVVEQFELAGSAETTVDTTERVATFEFGGVLYDEEISPTHPVVSFVGTGLAFWLDRPVTVERESAGKQVRIVCRW